MYKLNLDDFTKIVVLKIQEIFNKEVVLSTPKSNSNFPCTVVRTPIETINLIDQDTGEIISKTFTITIEEWDNSKYEVMNRMCKTSEKLRELNIIKNNNDNDIFDDITKKYRLISSYEVIYDGLYNCFKIKK